MANRQECLHDAVVLHMCETLRNLTPKVCLWVCAHQSSSLGKIWNTQEPVSKLGLTFQLAEINFGNSSSIPTRHSFRHAALPFSVVP